MLRRLLIRHLPLAVLTSNLVFSQLCPHRRSPSLKASSMVLLARGSSLQRSRALFLHLRRSKLPRELRRCSRYRRRSLCRKSRRLSHRGCSHRLSLHSQHPKSSQCCSLCRECSLWSSQCSGLSKSNRRNRRLQSRIPKSLPWSRAHLSYKSSLQRRQAPRCRLWRRVLVHMHLRRSLRGKRRPCRLCRWLRCLLKRPCLGSHHLSRSPRRLMRSKSSSARRGPPSFLISWAAS